MVKVLVLFSISLIFLNCCKAYDRCVPENYCMACSLNTANKCEACFNWGSGKILAKALNTTTEPNNCLMDVGIKVNDCKYYIGTTTDSALTATVETCQQCSKTFLIWKAESSVATCNNEATNCTKISNCQTTICFIGAVETTSGCRMCNKNYSGSNFDLVNSSGSARCVKANSINNCEYTKQQSTTVTHCYACKKDYAVSFNDLYCEGFTSDSNCRKLATDNSGCWYCWHSYYWDMDFCKLLGNIVSPSI